MPPRAWLAAVALAVLPVFACGRAAPGADAERLAAAEAEAKAYADAQKGLERDVAQLRGENRELRENLDRLRNELTSAAAPCAPAASTPAAPDPRVAELEQQILDGPGELAPPPVAPVQERQRAQPRVSAYVGPYVQAGPNGVTVTGKLWNSGDGDADLELEVELLLDGQVVDRGRQRVQVPARTELAYSQEFEGGPQEGTYSARVRLGR